MIWNGAEKEEIPVQIRTILLVMVVLTTIPVVITLASAEVTELIVSPQVVMQGENLSISGTASPNEEIMLNSSFELFIPVSAGTYYREFNGLYFPENNKSFSATVWNVTTIGMYIEPVFGNQSLGPIDATGGVATISISFPYETPNFTINIWGEKNVTVYGNAVAGASLVKLELNLSVCVIADSNGYFELLDLSTSGIPVGDYLLSADGEQETVQVISSPIVALVIVSPENKTYSSTSVNLNYIVDPPEVVLDWAHYVLDGGAPVNVTGNKKIKDLSSGSHSVMMRACDTYGNLAVSSTVNFTIHAGDINGDGVVNVFDLQQLAWAFMSHPDDPNWNENADLNCDGVVNVFDLQILAWNFMNKYY